MLHVTSVSFRRLFSAHDSILQVTVIMHPAAETHSFTVPCQNALYRGPINPVKTHKSSLTKFVDRWKKYVAR